VRGPIAHTNRICYLYIYIYICTRIYVYIYVCIDISAVCRARACPRCVPARVRVETSRVRRKNEAREIECTPLEKNIRNTKSQAIVHQDKTRDTERERERERERGREREREREREKERERKTDGDTQTHLTAVRNGSLDSRRRTRRASADVR